MKPSQERLHDALGELIYAVAKADGVVQASEKKKLRKMLQEQYADLFDILYQVASASNGLDSKEAKLIVQFKLELKAHFMDWKGD